MKLPTKTKDRENLRDIFMEVLEKQMGKGDREQMIKQVGLFARANQKEFFKILASLEPKNLKVESEQKLMYINVGTMKEKIPVDLPTYDELDDVVSNEVESDPLN